MTNILTAISNIIENQNFEVSSDLSASQNRMNSMGKGLEEYIKNAFANTLDSDNELDRMTIFNQNFSWLGNKNNPPDIMIKEGDAIEVKKLESPNNSIALNSSYPKSNIQSSSPMITQACRDCENWTEKDLIYCIGHVPKASKILKSLWLVYGNIYASEHQTYQRIKNTISSGIKSIPDVEFSETNELGRVNKVDSLGITNLRIRGMWQIQNPRKVFNYLYKTETENNFELVSIIPLEKYNSFDEESRNRIENIDIEGFSIETKMVKNPNNPASLTEIKLITFIKK